jgi:hypothetical protein
MMLAQAQYVQYATEWSAGKVIRLRGLPGATLSVAQAVNRAEHFLRGNRDLSGS